MLEILNIKEGMPSIDEARRILLQAIRNARSRRISAIKLIHGYGSSGVGGALRVALRKSLSLRKKEGIIRFVVYGENWNPVDSGAQEALNACDELCGDEDLGRGNPGVTIIVF